MFKRKLLISPFPWFQRVCPTGLLSKLMNFMFGSSMNGMKPLMLIGLCWYPVPHWFSKWSKLRERLGHVRLRNRTSVAKYILQIPLKWFFGMILTIKRNKVEHALTCEHINTIDIARFIFTLIFKIQLWFSDVILKTTDLYDYSLFVLLALRCE